MAKRPKQLSGLPCAKGSLLGGVGLFWVTIGRKGGVGRVYTTARGLHGNETDIPEAVETVDEIVIGIRKSSGFDSIRGCYFHLYGTDICMSAKENGMNCYAVPAVCIHNTNQLIELPEEFYQCYYHVKRRWKKYLPYTPLASE